MAGTTVIGRRTFLAGVLASAAVTSACTFDNNAGEGSSGGDGGTLRQAMIPVETLDPAIGGGSSYANILQVALLEGLTVLNEDGTDVLPGAAQDWTVSDDQLTYTFTINPDARWSNGDPVTAGDFEWNWRRLLSPATAAANADISTGVPSYDATAGVRGATAFLTGATDDFGDVGVRAVDDMTLEVVLDAPNPDLLFLLASYWALPLHPGTVEEHAQAWSDPANWVGNGAFVLESFRLNASATLLANDRYWDADSYHIDRWEVRFSEGGGSVDVLSYQADEIDIMNAGSVLTTIASDQALADGLLKGPTTNVSTLVLMASKNPVLYDVRVRRALSLAIDRQAIAELQSLDPGVSLVPGGVEGTERVPTLEHDLDVARELLSDAGYAGGDGMPTIMLLNPGSDTSWLEAIAEMWRSTLNVETRLDTVERGVYTERRFQVQEEDYAGFYAGSFGVNPPTMFRGIAASLAGLDPRIQANALPAGPAAEYRAIDADAAVPAEQKTAQLQAILDQHLFAEFKEFVTLAKQGLAEPDAQRRDALLNDAAVAREEAHVVIPVSWSGYAFLVRPSVRGLRIWADGSVFTTRAVTVNA